jgi:hypothetical protein
MLCTGAVGKPAEQAVDKSLPRRQDKAVKGIGEIFTNPARNKYWSFFGHPA